MGRYSYGAKAYAVANLVDKSGTGKYTNEQRGISQWPKGTDCKSAGETLGGRNPHFPHLHNRIFQKRGKEPVAVGILNRERPGAERCRGYYCEYVLELHTEITVGYAGCTVICSSVSSCSVRIRGAVICPKQGVCRILEEVNAVRHLRTLGGNTNSIVLLKRMIFFVSKKIRRRPCFLG